MGKLGRCLWHPGKEADTKTLQGIADHLVRRGAEQILVACTDLSVLSPSEWMNGPVTDVLDILAEAAVRECLRYPAGSI